MDNLQNPRDPISSDFVQERRPPMTTPLMTLVIAIAGLSGLDGCAAGQLSGGSVPNRKETGPGGGDPARPQSLAPRKYSGQIRGLRQMQVELAHLSRSQRCVQSVHFIERPQIKLVSG